MLRHPPQRTSALPGMLPSDRLNKSVGPLAHSHQRQLYVLDQPILEIASVLCPKHAGGHLACTLRIS